MAETHETIADIIAEMETERPGLMNGPINTNNSYYARRLKAAHKRELSKNMSKSRADFGQLSDAAKLREVCEALEELMKFTCNSCQERYCEEDVEEEDGQRIPSPCSVIIKARAALSAPPRNCDRFATADEAIGAYRQTHRYMVVNVFLDWLFATAMEQEGGKDGNE